MSDVKTVDEQELDYTKNLRKKIAEEILKKEVKDLEPKDLNVVLAALDGIDRQALTKMRIKSDEGVSSSQAEIAQAIVTAYMDPRMKRAARMRSETPQPIPELPDDLPVPKIMEGEMDSNVSRDDYASFMAKHGNKAAADKPAEA